MAWRDRVSAFIGRYIILDCNGMCVMYVRGRAWYWYLIPALLGVIAGAIMWFIFRNSEPEFGRNCLLVGIASTILGIVVSFMAPLP